MLPLIPFYQSFSLRSLLTRCRYALSVQHYSSSIRPPVAPFSPSSKTKGIKSSLIIAEESFSGLLAGANTQTFDGMIDFRREQARRTILVHVKHLWIEMEMFC